MSEIEIKSIDRFEDYIRCAELQKLIWNFSDLELIPPRLFKLYQFVGGSVLGAFTKDNVLVGFALAQPSFHYRERSWHSNVLAVHPDFQNRNIGFHLKRVQRLEALKNNIALITWTFDPLQARNSHFNLNRLGVRIRSYLKNAYGPKSSRLIHGGLGTDRVLAEWEINSSLVDKMMNRADASPRETENHLPSCFLQLKNSSDSKRLHAVFPDWRLESFCLEIPGDLTNLLHYNLPLAKEWRRKFRVLMTTSFSRGYQVTRMARYRTTEPDDQSGPSWAAFYILEKC